MKLLRLEFFGYLLVFFVLLTLAACDDSQSEEDDNEITQALIELSDGNCQSALNILDAMTNMETNARWHQTKASAQACFTDFNEITFFSVDADLIDTTSLTTLGRSFPILSTSDDMTTATDVQFTSLYDAVTTLISAGSPTTNNFAGRGEVFNTFDNTNITLQALYFSIGNVGQYMRYYGNADATGTKGAGGGGNGCYMDYTDGTAAAIIIAQTTGSCGGAGDAHPDMTDTRACNGIVLINTIFNALQNIDVPSDSGSTSDIDDTINSLITTCQGAIAPNDICTVVDQATCEAQGNAIIQQYFAAVMEQMHL